MLKRYHLEKVKSTTLEDLTFSRTHACPPLMRFTSPKPLPYSRAEKLRHLGSNLRTLLIWPLVFGTLAAALWVWAYWMIDHEKRAIGERAFSSAAAQSRAYADQLDRIIGQVDYIMLSLKYHWQQTHGGVNLEEQVRQGLVPVSPGLSVTIINRDGDPVTSTQPLLDAKFNVAGRPYFQAHRDDPSLGMQFSRPMAGLRLKRPVLILSRRLDDGGGAFDGLIVVAIEPAYLSSFVDDAGLRDGDVIAARRSDGAFLASRLGNGKSGSRPAMKGDPVFDKPAGLRLMPGEHFIDGRARFVGWHSARNYPVVALVGLAEDGLLASYGPRENELWLIALAGSAMLLLITGISVSLASLRIWRTQYEREVQATYRLATDSAREGFYMLRPLYDKSRNLVDFLIEDCNERGAMYRGLPRARLLGSRLSQMVPVLFERHMLPACREAMESGFLEDEMHLPARNGRETQWLQRRLVRSTLGLAVTLRDITDQKAHQEALVQMANADPVTTLPNRHWLMRTLPGAIERARGHASLLAVLFVDLDDFKNVNDTLGHAAGDELLRAAALRLKALVRHRDSIARLGGDEFTVVLESAVNEAEVLAVAERIIETLADPFVIGEGSRHMVRASIGVSLYPRDGVDGATLLKHADIAMYAAKADGKGRVRLFQPRLSEMLISRLTQQADLHHAIDAGQLELHYQARVLGSSGEICSMEALVRWRHPLRGLIAPDDFIPLAEENGMIVRVGEQVISAACAQLAQWKAEGLPLVPLSINVSPRQIDNAGVSSYLAGCLERHGLDAAQIEVEITESATMTTEGAGCAEIAAIRALGVKLYVDDFGTGYSSLSQLRMLDMDGLKVDQSFTAQLGAGPEDLAFFTAIVSMAHAIGMRVVAEGVETLQQLQILQELRCDEVQGYYVSPPVPPAAAAQLLKKRFLFPC
jgi:diguanylate cyclase (GGDEF)-like protein